MTAQIRGLAQGGCSVTLEGGGKEERGIAAKEGGMEVGEERREGERERGREGERERGRESGPEMGRESAAALGDFPLPLPP